MTWNDVIADKSLQDLPYKIETNGYGQVVMSPASHYHNRFQGVIYRLMSELAPSGEPLMECSIETDDGVKVADVAWLSSAFIKAHEFQTPYKLSPEMCVEVISPSNSRAEMRQKRELYFSQGATEVWLCDSAGAMRFFDRNGELSQTELFPSFPKTVCPSASN